MRKLVYRGYILSNTDGLTDSWTLTIGQTSRTGSLFELRRQINFFEELGILPQPKIADATDTETAANKPLQTRSQKAQTASRQATDGKAAEGKTKERKAGKGGAGGKAPVKAHSEKTLPPKAVSHSKDGENRPSRHYPTQATPKRHNRSTSFCIKVSKKATQMWPFDLSNSGLTAQS
ncbi:hypothetical protein ACLKZ7_05855 [Shewanella algae]|uniref:hypothetical protein n=1 Tax=Shewanella algae TaxID=38313 RepID=UPI003984B0F2